MNSEPIVLTQYQRGLVLGTLLGTGSIIKPRAGRNAVLQLRGRKSGDVDWLYCKAAELSSVARPHPFAEDKDSVHWASVANPVWNGYMDMCYRDGHKVVTQAWLESLTDLAMAVWFLDKGYEQGGHAHLRLARLDGHQLVPDYFNSMSYECELLKGALLRFTAGGTERFMKLILPRFPKYLLDALSLPNPSCIGRSRR